MAQAAYIPLEFGLGTWELRGRACARVVEQALRLGYRHIDTAEMYDNERDVGEGLRASGVKRSEVFVTTKIWPNHFTRRVILEDALARDVSGAAAPRRKSICCCCTGPIQNVPLAETIGALCKAKREQACAPRHIGVSNFTVALVEQAMAAATEPLVCDQVECHPFLDQSKVLAACRSHGMALVAYSACWRCGQFRRNEVLNRIGAMHQKTAAQICLRYLVQQGIVVIPRSSKLERLTENASLFDFTLSESEMAEIAGLAHPDGRTDRGWAYSGTHEAGIELSGAYIASGSTWFFAEQGPPYSSSIFVWILFDRCRPPSAGPGFEAGKMRRKIHRQRRGDLAGLTHAFSPQIRRGQSARCF